MNDVWSQLGYFLELVSRVVGGGWSQLNSTDMRVLAGALIATCVITLVQLMIFVRIRPKWLVVLIWLTVDMVIVTMIGWGELVTNWWFEQLLTPRSVVIERIGDQLVDVKWKSFDPDYSIVMWGYQGEPLQELALGTSSDQKTKVHEVLFQVDRRDPVRIKIISQGEGSSTESLAELK